MGREEKIEIRMPSSSKSSSLVMDAFAVFPDKPKTQGKVRAVVLIQEAFGVNSHMRALCHKFAEQGYIAISPELFHRSGRGLEFSYDDFAKVMPVFSKLKNDEILEDLGATFSFLEKSHHVTSQQTAVIGYCMGGLVAMMSATHQPIATAIPYYGGGMVSAREGIAMAPILHQIRNIECPVLLFFGGADKHIPIEDIQKVEAELTAHHKTFECIVYPGADHGFSNDERSSYHPEATQKAWDKTLDWLKKI